MKKAMTGLLAFLMLFLSVPFTLAQGEPEAALPQIVAVELLKGKSAALKDILDDEIYAQQKNLVWTSSDRTVVAYAKGKLSAKSVGAATITGARKADGVAIVRLEAVVYEPVKSIKLNSAKTTLLVGDALQLVATLSPTDAHDLSVTWSSNKPDVAEVDEFGTVSAVAKGTAIVTCTSNDGSGKKAACQITVKTEYGDVSSAYIAKYKLPKAIANVTLTEEEAKELVSRTPSEAAERIKTLGDALIYLKAKNFKMASVGATPQYVGDGIGWAFANTGEKCLELNMGCCCGGAANVLCYLLAGDYSDVGQIRWMGNGNHTITYIKSGDKFYVFDLTRFCDGGRYKDYDAPVTVLETMGDYWKKMPSSYLGKGSRSGIEMLFYYSCDGAGYPWTRNGSGEQGYDGLIFPEGTTVSMIYSKENKYGIYYRPLNMVIPGWNG